MAFKSFKVEAERARKRKQQLEEEKRQQERARKRNKVLRIIGAGAAVATTVGAIYGSGYCDGYEKGKNEKDENTTEKAVKVSQRSDDSKTAPRALFWAINLPPINRIFLLLRRSMLIREHRRSR